MDKTLTRGLIYLLYLCFKKSFNQNTIRLWKSWIHVIYCVFVDAQLMIPPSTLLWLVTTMDRSLVRPPSLSRVSPLIMILLHLMSVCVFYQDRTGWLAGLDAFKPDTSRLACTTKSKRMSVGHIKVLKYLKWNLKMTGMTSSYWRSHAFNGHYQLFYQVKLLANVSTYIHLSQ